MAAARQQQGSTMAHWVVSLFIHVTIFLVYLYSDYHNYIIITPMFQERILPHIIPADKLHYFPGLWHKTLFMTQWNAVSTHYIIINSRYSGTTVDATSIGKVVRI